MANYGKLLLLLTMILITTGCWDRVEIDKRGFVIGAAIDASKEKKSQGDLKESSNSTGENGTKQYALTYQFVIPSALGGGGGGGGMKGGGSESNTFKNITMDGDTMFEITREMATKVSRTPYFEHIKVIIVSEDVAKSGEMPDALDFFLRDPEMRRGTLVMVAKGDAHEVLDVKTTTEKLPVLQIQSIAKNTRKSARMLHETRIGDIQKYFLQDLGYVLPRVVVEGKQIQISGACVFKGGTNKLIGYLNEKETEGLNFIIGEIKGGLIKIPITKKLDVFEIKSAMRSIKVDATNPQHLKFVLSIETEGDLAETFKQQDYLQMTTLNELEKKVGKEIQSIVEGTINTMQKDLKTDGLGLGEYLKVNNPKVWNQVKQDWNKGENYFTQCSIEVKTKVNIRNIGSVSHIERAD